MRIDIIVLLKHLPVISVIDYIQAHHQNVKGRRDQVTP